jgi:hypothetical protein
MKAHVVLKKRIVIDQVLRAAAVERVLAVGRMVLENPRRLKRHGIITGELKPERLDEVRALPEVEAVELDEEEFAQANWRRHSALTA